MPLFCQDFSKWLVISLLYFCAWTGCLRKFRFFLSLSLNTSFPFHFAACASCVRVSSVKPGPVWASSSRPHLPAAVLVLGVQSRPSNQVHRIIQSVVCVQKLSSPYTFVTALFTVYRLLIWGPLWASWNYIWHSVLPVWEEWVSSCSSKGWDPKNIGKK